MSEENKYNQDEESIKNAGLINHSEDEEMDFNEGLDAVRIDPGVYLDSTDCLAIMHLLYEVIDNTVDESNKPKYINTRKIKTNITLNPDGSVKVEDNASGIPINMTAKGILACYVAVEKVHGGTKLRNKKKDTQTIGTHGIGLSATTACSRWIKVTIKREGKIQWFKYEAVDLPNGTTTIKRTQDLTQIGTCSPEDTGTTIEFMYDDRVLKLEHPEFGKVKYPYILEEIKERLTNYMLFNKNIEFQLTYDTPDQGKGNYSYKDSAEVQERELRRYEKKEPIITDVYSRDERNFRITTKLVVSEGVHFVKTGVNGLFLANGGVHRNALEKCLISYVYKMIEMKGVLDEEYPLYESDITSNFSFIQDIRVDDPQFAGQVKNYLTDTEISNWLIEYYNTAVPNFSSKFLNKLIKITKEQYVNRVEQAKALKEKRSKQKKRITDKDKLAFGAFIYDCIKNKNCIAKYVEGGSAGVGVGDYRDNNYVTLVELQGKLANYIKRDGKKVFDEKGKLIDKLKDDPQYKKLDMVLSDSKYIRHELAADADVDGKHIRLLWLTVIIKEHPHLIEEGKVYFIIPPIAKATYNGGKVKYYYSLEEMHEDLAVQPWGKTAVVRKYKGIGELKKEETKDCILEHPKLVRIKFSPKEERKEEIELLVDTMGENNSYRQKVVKENFAGPNLINYLNNRRKKVNETRNFIDPLNVENYIETDDMEEEIKSLFNDIELEDVTNEDDE